MPSAPSRRALDRLVPWLAGATVLAFAAGSSSVPDVKRIGHDVRWLLLLALAAVAAAAAPSIRRLPAAVLLAAGGLVGLALVSATWSVAPHSTAGRGLSLALLLGTAVLVAAGGVSGERVLLGLLGGAAVVAVLGALVLAASYGTAVTAASIEAPARFRGFGEDPNTASLLLALALPIGLYLALVRRGPVRWLAVAAVVLFAASIVGSGSRGALLAAAVGSAVTIVAAGRRWLGLAAVVAAAVVAGALQSLPQNASTGPPAAASAPARVTHPRYVDVEQAYPLDNDVGRPLPGGGEPNVTRSFFGTSGRTAAWKGAIEQAAGRPLLGFGFGTEARVFVDRYYAFFGGLPENSYIGIALQLGIVGLLALLGLVAVLVATGRRALRRPSWAAAAAGVVAAGLTVALVQSYLYSVGNIGTALFWLAAFLLPAFALAEEA